MSFKALRRSRDGRSSSTSSPSAVPLPLSRPMSVKTFTPQKVIRSLDARRATSPQELSFEKGDFFYVIKEIEVGGVPYYEAMNPVTNGRGIVPRGLFEEFKKGVSATPRTSTFAAAGLKSPSSPVPPTPRHQTFYAIVQYDFIAERPDELDAKAGEPISVVAQSNREWFVAKPIGRLGGPGLIPVSFVEIRDLATGRKMADEEVAGLMDRGSLPKVEEWKKATMNYKASSIPLGVIDTGPVGGGVPSSPYMDRSFQVGDIPQRSASMYSGGNAGEAVDERGEADDEEILPPGLLIAASIPSFHRESGEYWFRLNIDYQPDLPLPSSADPSPAPSSLISAVLYRNYDDFYAFQLDLLDLWPVEAGRQRRSPDSPEPTEEDRILPYMPGPVPVVDDAVTAERQRELDIYVKELVDLALPHIGAEHVLRCEHVRRFLSQKPGDVILPPGHPSNPSVSVSGSGAGRAGQDADELYVEGLRLEDDDNGGYDDRPTSTSAGSNRPARTSAYSQEGDWGRQSSYQNNGYFERERANSTYDSGASRTSAYNNQPSTGNTASIYSNHARSPSSVTHVGSAEPTPSFLKVKIFHSSTDDLIAIRVSPKITYNQLLAKVRDRLGEDVNELKYRGEGHSRVMRIIEDDEGLREWVAENSKLVLFAY